MTRLNLLVLVSVLAGCGNISTVPGPPVTDDVPIIGDDDDDTVIGDDDDDVGANDTDPNGDLAPDTIVSVDLPAIGTPVIMPGGVIGYRHDGSETTSDSFTDNNPNWGSDDTVPNEYYAFGSCHLNCSCLC
jgi:hypothetical protein